MGRRITTAWSGSRPAGLAARVPFLYRSRRPVARRYPECPLPARAAACRVIELTDDRSNRPRRRRSDARGQRVAPCLALLLALLGVAISARGASGVTLYRIGTPFSGAEKDSLEALGVEFREIGWSPSQLEEGLELDSLAAGSLQPSFFAEDDDIAASLLARDGWVRLEIHASDNTLVGQVLVDGDPTTSYTWSEIAPESFNDRYFEKVTFALGGEFLIKEVRFHPLAGAREHFLEHYRIGVSEPGFSLTRTPIFPALVDIEGNAEHDVRVRLARPVTTAFVQLVIYRVTRKEIGLADFEVYGGGYVSESSYESDVIELDDNASWGRLRWSGQRDPEARIDIRTRTGADPQPVIFWELRPEQQDSVRFLQGGGDLGLTEYKRRYDRLLDVLKPADPEDWLSVDTENWSFWSSPYAREEPGTQIVSPGPRRYFQVRVDFSSTITDGGKLDYLEFEASVPPAVRRLTGEIYPTQAAIGQATRFTYYIRPTIRVGDSGFDGVEIATPSGVISVDSLRLGGVNQDAFRATIHEEGLGFDVVLPRRLGPTDSGALIEVVFHAPLLREVGTLFDGWVFDSSRPHEVRQRIAPGNAADEIESDLLSVRTALTGSLIFAPRAVPNPFTPNGDNVNDTAAIAYTLLRVTTPVPVRVEILDLSGRLVKRVYSGDDPIGEYSRTWDGTDSTGQRVSPGIYLYRIVAHLQSERQVAAGSVAVAF